MPAVGPDTRLSFEFFPPRDSDGQARLIDSVAGRLSAFKPQFFSVTYGAGGSTRDGTQQTIAALLDAGYDAAPHLSMGSDGDDDIAAMLERYREQGVSRIVALRGDQPSGMGRNRFANNAEALVKLIRKHTENHFDLTVAAYPEVHPDARSAASDLDFFRRKVDAGANSAITQYFYNADAFEDFMNRCAQAGIEVPIYPGVMPITNVESLLRFSEKCGAEVPRWLRYGMADRQDDERDLSAYGVDVCTDLCSKLLRLGAPGLHFYTLNRWGSTSRICQNLGYSGTD